MKLKIKYKWKAKYVWYSEKPIRLAIHPESIGVKKPLPLQGKIRKIAA